MKRGFFTHPFYFSQPSFFDPNSFLFFSIFLSHPTCHLRDSRLNFSPQTFRFAPIHIVFLFLCLPFLRLSSHSHYFFSYSPCLFLPAVSVFLMLVFFSPTVSNFLIGNYFYLQMSPFSTGNVLAGLLSLTWLQLLTTDVSFMYCESPNGSTLSHLFTVVNHGCLLLYCESPNGSTLSHLVTVVNHGCLLLYCESSNRSTLPHLHGYYTVNHGCLLLYSEGLNRSTLPYLISVVNHQCLLLYCEGLNGAPLPHLVTTVNHGCLLLCCESPNGSSLSLTWLQSLTTNVSDCTGRVLTGLLSLTWLQGWANVLYKRMQHSCDLLRSL